MEEMNWVVHTPDKTRAIFPSLKFQEVIKDNETIRFGICKVVIISEGIVSVNGS